MTLVRWLVWRLAACRYSVLELVLLVWWIFDSFIPQFYSPRL